MATAEDLLKKAELRKKKGAFIPERRRAWDYSTQESAKSLESNLENDEGKIGTNIGTDIGTNIGTDIGTIRNKVGTNIGTDIGTNIGTIGNKYRNIIRNNSESSEHKNPIQNLIQLPEEIASKKDTKSEEYILTVLRKTTGYQQKIMEQLTAHIKNMKENVNVINIPISTLSERIQAENDITRTSIKRLQRKSILLKSSGGRGRHGDTKVVVPNFVIKECLNLFNCAPLSLEENRNIIGNKYRNNFLHSSSSININNNTTEENEFLKNWGEIDFDSLKEIGFSVTQLKQLQSKNTPEIVQESINHFSFGLQSNPKIKKYPEPLNVLMGVLRKGQAWVEPHYQSPQEIAQREFIERKKAERERIKKLEEETYNLAFDEWLDSLTVEKTEEVAPAKPSDGLFSPQRVRLSLYFRENVWASKKAEYSK